MTGHTISDDGPRTIRVQHTSGTLRTYTADRFHITAAGVLVLEGVHHADQPAPITLHISPHAWNTFYAQPTTPGE